MISEPKKWGIFNYQRDIRMATFRDFDWGQCFYETVRGEVRLTSACFCCRSSRPRSFWWCQRWLVRRCLGIEGGAAFRWLKQVLAKASSILESPDLRILVHCRSEGSWERRNSRRFRRDEMRPWELPLCTEIAEQQTWLHDPEPPRRICRGHRDWTDSRSSLKNLERNKIDQLKSGDKKTKQG